MEKLDLNLDHYDLNDILNLFHLKPDFDEEDLKKAKKIVLKTHPDKSGLKPEIFLFYSKAYKSLFSIWEFTNKHKLLKKASENVVIIDEKDENNHKKQWKFDKDKEKVLDNLFENNFSKDSKKFNQWFNKEFEKTNIRSEDQTNGYGDWLKSNEDIEDEKHISQAFIGEEFERKKKQMRDRDMVIHTGVNEINCLSSFGTNLNSDVPDSYSSDIFSNLYYEDLKKAHTETVVPVTMEDYHNVPKFHSLDEYRMYRSSQNIVPLSELQANEYLNNRAKIENSETVSRAYKLSKQTEELKKRQDVFWSNLMKITDK